MEFVQVADDHYRVVYRHYRYPEATVSFCRSTGRSLRRIRLQVYHKRGDSRSPWVPYGDGGATEVMLFKVTPLGDDWARDKDGRIKCEFAVSAMSVCSIYDQFNYKRGRDIALGRALKALRGG